MLERVFHIKEKKSIRGKQQNKILSSSCACGKLVVMIVMMVAASVEACGMLNHPDTDQQQTRRSVQPSVRSVTVADSGQASD